MNINNFDYDSRLLQLHQMLLSFLMMIMIANVVNVHWVISSPHFLSRVPQLKNYQKNSEKILFKISKIV